MLDRLYGIVPRDKLMHFGVMALIALFNAAAAAIALELPVLHDHPIAVFIVLLAGTVGAVKEAEDKADNDLMAERGQPALHGVEIGDFIATLLGGVFVAGVLLAMGII